MAVYLTVFQACVRDCVSDCVSGMHSFGLHSPDMLPVADVDFQTMSDVDLNHLPPEVYQAIYHPDTNMIPAQKLYFDPDIIGKRLYASILLPSWSHTHRQKSLYNNSTSILVPYSKAKVCTITKLPS